METLTFRAVQDGERIDRYLSGCLEDLSRSYIQKLVKDGNIRVDGRIVKANYKLSAGEEIRVLVPEPEVPDIRPENIPLDILYEDDDMLVINKPARLGSVPGVRETVSAKSILEKTHGELFVVHRLDLDTSGVLAFAKNKTALARMNDSFRGREAKKTYVARLEGELLSEAGDIALPLGLNWLDRPRQCVIPISCGGKEALTHYRLIDTIQCLGKSKAIVELGLETGRTHQLRLHCAKGLGLPIDGDPFYGTMGLMAESGATRLCLHAKSLSFEHPNTGKTMLFEAPANFPEF